MLEAFAGRERALSLVELAQASGLDKSSVQRVTRTLRDIGYLDQDPVTRRYMLGSRVLDLSYNYLRTHPLIERALPVLVDLRRVVKERVDLVVPDHDTVLYVLRMQAKRETFRPALIGRRVPVFCTAAGRAMLAHDDEAEAARIINASDRVAYTRHTLTDPDAILSEIRRARRQGYAVQSEEWLPVEMVGAAAVLDSQGAPIAAVNIAVSTRDWERDAFEQEMMPPLMAAAAELSR
ncbi:IclR family transcriptional regulator [Belnapia sp. T6]|uniref:IclR family transcriptional regulator n=1 Tax=Belnapia mucosa TaxID=2804532 RepID=A0ABS1UX73_9PROT|nr:IclR family transcriptional regulator [Belnapia mucosa]